MPPSSAPEIREFLLGLPDVTGRPEFGNEAYYVGGTHFAGITDRAVTMPLPAAALTDALTRGLARPLLSVGALARNRWVEVALDGTPPAEIERLLLLAHNAARHAHRRTRPRHPSRARHRSGDGGR